MTTAAAAQLARDLGVDEDLAEDLEGLTTEQLLDLERGLRLELELAAGLTVTRRNRRVRNRETNLSART